MEAAFRSVRDGGGRCVLAGNVAHGLQIAIDPYDLIRGRQIKGTWGGSTDPDRDIPRYADQFMSGAIDLEQLITRTFALEEVNDALDRLEAGSEGRGLLDMSVNNPGVATSGR